MNHLHIIWALSIDTIKITNTDNNIIIPTAEDHWKLIERIKSTPCMAFIDTFCPCPNWPSDMIWYTYFVIYRTYSSTKKWMAMCRSFNNAIDFAQKLNKNNWNVEWFIDACAERHICAIAFWVQIGVFCKKSRGSTKSHFQDKKTNLILNIVIPWDYLT